MPDRIIHTYRNNVNTRLPDYEIRQASRLSAQASHKILADEKG
jgi:hypothetical protein